MSFTPSYREIRIIVLKEENFTMENSKDNFINEVISSMSVDLNGEDLRKLRNVMFTKLKNKDVTENTTEIVLSEKPKWQYHMDMWLACKKLKNCSSATIDNYRLALSNLFSTLQKDVSNITSNDIRGYMDWYQSGRGKMISASYLNTLHRYYSSFFTWLANEGIINKNPMTSVEYSQEPEIIKEAFSTVELEKIRRICNTPRDIALIEVLFATGARVSEIAKINKGDINFYDKSIVIYGKRKKQRVAYLTDVSIYYIKKYLESRADENEALFVSLRKPYNRIQKNGIESRLHTLGELANVENVHPHRFRRTLATTALAKGIEPYKLQEIMGHDKLETTMIYCNIPQSDIKNSYMKYIS
jgi:integrase/recombinase XerD